jgi:hypothetical protein
MHPWRNLAALQQTCVRNLPLNSIDLLNWMPAMKCKARKHKRREGEHSGNVALVVHALVQDAHDIDAAVGRAVEQDMRARRVLPLAGPHFRASATQRWVVGYRLDALPDLARVGFGSIKPPAIRGVRT